MDIITVTGTKGTTTTTHFLYDAITRAVGRPVGIVSTMRMFDGQMDCDNEGYTTPPAPAVQKCAARAEANGCAAFVLELSSVGEKEGRADGLRFQYGIFTNFGADHIGSADEHADLAEYYHYKRQIVKRYEQAVLNRDEACFDDLVRASREGCGKRVVSYSVKADSGADVYADNIRRTDEGMAFTVVTPSWRLDTTIALPGLYNVSNALAAFAVIYLMGIDPVSAADAIRATRIPGRSETYSRKGYTVVVDYAHNAISFKAILSEMRIRHPNGKVCILYGVGGNRGERRRGMAEESAKGADRVYVTSDNPRDDDPVELCETLKALIESNGGQCRVIVDREAAVRQAFKDMEAGDVLILAGKGPEKSIVIHGETIPYPGDAALAAEFINSLE